MVIGPATRGSKPDLEEAAALAGQLRDVQGLGLRLPCARSFLEFPGVCVAATARRTCGY